MEKSNKTKTTQEDSQKNFQSNPTGLIYWCDYDFKSENTVSSKLRVNFKLS